MIQDIEPKKLHNEYSTMPPTEESRTMIFWDHRILCRIREGERLSYPTYGEVREQMLREGKQEADIRWIYLFCVDEMAYYLIRIRKPLHLTGYSYERMFRLRRTIPMDEMFAGVSAYHLYCWYEENRYCGHCGKSLSMDENQRMLQCTECGQMIFPRINPAVIVAVCHGDEILLTKYADREYKRYALIAGFAEFGETIEQTVKREVMEEVGIEVGNLRYYGSQPWGFSGSLLLGFFAEAVGDLSIRRQEEELSEALWVKAEDVVLDQEEISLTREMMKVFKEKICP